ncbi:MAG: helix-turn-helix domain-containing protein [Shimia sp.]|nr:helix-turn-helix domain-containing protein [Shimia sp.]
MTRRKKDPLRPLEENERDHMERLSRARSAPSEQVIRARILLGVATGMGYEEAARTVGRKSGDAVSNLVSRFNQEGLAALEPRHGGGPAIVYGEAERGRIVQAAQRKPDLEKDGVTQWTLSTLQKALRTAPDGFANISTWTIFHVLHEAGWSCQQDGSWCETGKVERKRQGQVVEVTDPDAAAKKLD